MADPFTSTSTLTVDEGTTCSTKSDPSEARITLWNKKEMRKVSGNAAPKQRNCLEYIRQHPEVEIFDGQDLRLTEQEKEARAEIASRSSRVPVRNKKDGRIYSGNAAPLEKNLAHYLKSHPDCEIFEIFAGPEKTNGMVAPQQVDVTMATQSCTCDNWDLTELGQSLGGQSLEDPWWVEQYAEGPTCNADCVDMQQDSKDLQNPADLMHLFLQLPTGNSMEWMAWEQVSCYGPMATNPSKLQINNEFPVSDGFACVSMTASTSKLQVSDFDFTGVDKCLHCAQSHFDHFMEIDDND